MTVAVGEMGIVALNNTWSAHRARDILIKYATWPGLRFGRTADSINGRGNFLRLKSADVDFVESDLSSTFYTDRVWNVHA